MIGTDRSVITSKKSTSSQPQTAAYSNIKAILIEAYPEALSMDDLVKATDHQWKRSEIFLAANHGTQMNELLRDATYHPARYKINPERIPSPADKARVPGKQTKEKAVALESHAMGQTMVTIVHKKKKTLEMPRKASRPGAKLAKKPRRTGVFKDIVTCLIQSGVALDADEILKRSGIQSSKAVLMAVLSDRLAKQQLARLEGSKPYRYFVPASLKTTYMMRFGIEGESVISATPTIAAPPGQAEVAAMPPVHSIAADSDASIEPHFDIAVTLRGNLTLTINGQKMTLKPEWTHQLAKMIRHMAD